MNTPARNGDTGRASNEVATLVHRSSTRPIARASQRYLVPARISSRTAFTASCTFVAGHSRVKRE